MTTPSKTSGTAFLVVSVLLLSTIGAIAILHPGLSASSGTTPSISAQLTAFVGPTCTATISGENVQNNAIQSEINTYASTPGAIICITPGTYPEQLTITGTTDLTLWGSGNTSTLLAPTSVSVNQHDLDSGLPTYALVGANNNSGLTVANIGINGTLSAASAVGCDGFNGIYYANTSGTIENTSVTGINQNGGCQGQNAVVVNNGYFLTNLAPSVSVSIVNNTVTGYGKNGITCNDPGVVCTISGNTVGTTPMPLGYSATNGIQFYGAAGTIRSNTVTGNDYLPAWCGAGNYFYAGGGPCQGNALAEATGILLYAPGSGVNVSGNQLAGDQIAIADIGGPISAWDNSVLSAGFYGIVLDFNATPGWLGSPVFAAGPYLGVAGNNLIENTNVGILVYDDNASLLSNHLSNVNVSVESTDDLPVAYQVDLVDNVASSNVSGALLGDLSSYQPGDTAAPVGLYTLTGNTFTNASVGSAGAPNGIAIFGQGAQLVHNQVTGFDSGVSVTLTPSGDLSALHNVLTAPVSPPAGAGVGLYAFVGNATISGNSVSGWSWMNGPGWWPNSQTAGLFAQCLETCTIHNNQITNNAIGIAVISYVYGPSPAPAWPYAAPASEGPIAITGNTVSDSGAFGIALELNQGPLASTATPSVAVNGNAIDNTATGAVGLMVDQGTYTIDNNAFSGTTLTGTSGASQPTGVGGIGTASIQVLNAYDYITAASLQGNAFFGTLLPLAVLNITSGGGFASASYGETVNFTESGLPSATPWYLNVTGIPPVALSTPGFFVDLQNGSYAYTAQDANPFYHAVTPSATVLVSGSALAVAVPFVLTTYDATFTETGLTAGTNWSVTIGATTLYSTTTTITFPLTNGSYSYTVSPLAGYAVTGSRTGSFTIAGSGFSRLVTWTPVTYTVDFSETGLLAGTNWQVTLGAQTASSTSTDVDFQAGNGTYSYAITPIAGYTTTWTGSVTVNGAGVTVPVSFTVVTYAVAFQETGLAPSTNWQVTVDATTSSSTGTSITFDLANGTYPYTIGSVSGYARTGTGSVTVSGSGKTVSVLFVPSVYTLTFAVRGLPHGTSWSVTADAVTHTSTTRFITFTLGNGTYPYTVGGQPGKHVIGGNTGNATVNGATQKIVVKFTTTKYKVTFKETGLPLGYTWQVKSNGHTVVSNSNKITFMFKNGTYSFTVKATGYTAVPSTGTFTINGAALIETITFS